MLPVGLCPLSLSLWFPKFSSCQAVQAAGRRCADCLAVGPMQESVSQTSPLPGQKEGIDTSPLGHLPFSTILAEINSRVAELIAG